MGPAALVNRKGRVVDRSNGGRLLVGRAARGRFGAPSTVPDPFASSSAVFSGYAPGVDALGKT